LTDPVPSIRPSQSLPLNCPSFSSFNGKFEGWDALDFQFYTDVV
jgi:hypothetical protein